MVKANLGKQFLQLIEKHIKRNNKLNKLINKNNRIISYICINNIKSTIKKHSRKTIKTYNNIVEQTNNNLICNCQNSSSCLLNNECYEEALWGKHFDTNKY